MVRILRVLQVEDFPDDAELILRGFRRAGYNLETLRAWTSIATVNALCDKDWNPVLSIHPGVRSGHSRHRGHPSHGPPGDGDERRPGSGSWLRGTDAAAPSAIRLHEGTDADLRVGGCSSQQWQVKWMEFQSMERSVKPSLRWASVSGESPRARGRVCALSWLSVSPLAATRRIDIWSCARGVAC